ncbi:glycosyltransferase family 4 protein [Micromonospora sp. RTGN7]|uniref:glycosyltransferase family 4 protein n=1 Tax=Micromonospora sp. RTGN7 TaxID=3016526 RepID=UPI0029FF30EA|nr:glycosyltransferase family 4 protein [Micromonospora sp. RTGN7]
MSSVIFLLERPTPQRTPTLDAMWRDGVDLRALYHDAADAQRGWGPVVPRHPHGVVPAGRLAALRFVLRQLREPDVDVLCCFGYHRPVNMAAILLARARGIRVVTRSDSNWLEEQARPPFRRLAKRLFLRALFGRRSRVWTVGRRNDRYWAAMGLTDRVLIPYGLPAPPVGQPGSGARFRRRHGLGDGLVVLSVGVLDARKGIDTLLAAFRAVPHVTARLVVVGQGPMAPLVAAEAAQDRRIVAPGALTQDELGPAYAAADVFVLASRREPWGLVVNEAKANGLRVVLTDVIGCAADLVDPEVDRVFPAGDAHALARILVELADAHACGWPPVAALPPYDASAEMAAQLRTLGATVARTRTELSGTALPGR